MLIKNFYNLYGGLSKTKKSLKKNKYKDYLTYLFAYLFLLLFIFYSFKDTLAAIEKTADKQYQNQKLLNIVLKQCNELKEIRFIVDQTKEILGSGNIEKIKTEEYMWSFRRKSD